MFTDNEMKVIRRLLNETSILSDYTTAEIEAIVREAEETDKILHKLTKQNIIASKSSLELGS